MYVKEETFAGRVHFVRKFESPKHHAPGRKRDQGTETTEKQKAALSRQNAKKREERLWLLIEANFGAGDSHSVLHYMGKEQPASIEEAEEDVTACLRKARALCRKAGVEFRWILATELYGKKGQLFHHHVLVNRPARDYLEEAWAYVMKKKGKNGKVSSARLDDRDSHRELAAYLLKQSERCSKEWAETGAEKKQRYRGSKNLQKPVTKRAVIKAHGWSQKPRTIKGYHLVKDAEGREFQYGISDLTGYPWQTYTEVRNE